MVELKNQKNEIQALFLSIENIIFVSFFQFPSIAILSEFASHG